MAQTLALLLTGAAGAAGIKLLESVIIWLLNRRAARHDGKTAQDKQQDVELAALKDALRVILFDRLRYLGKSYVHDGAVDYDDRRNLHKMHAAYHGLGGNGDLDTLMRDVDALPMQ